MNRRMSKFLNIFVIGCMLLGNSTFAVSSQSTTYSISGRVTDGNGNGVLGVSVLAVPNSSVGIEVLKPILMVTGWGGSETKDTSQQDENLAYLGEFLSSRGYSEQVNMFYAHNTSPKVNQEENAKRIRDEICKAHAKYKSLFHISPVFNIIGHSYGGLRARAYLESGMYKNNEPCPGTSDIIRVENLITLGTPHGGEWADLPLAELLGLIGFGSTLGSEIGIPGLENNWPAIYELIPSVREDQNKQSGGKPKDVMYHLVAGNAINQKDSFSTLLRFMYDFGAPSTRFIPNDMAVTRYRSFSLQNYPDLYKSLNLIETNDVHGLCDHRPSAGAAGLFCARLGLDNLQSYMYNSSTLLTEVWRILDASNKGLRIPLSDTPFIASDEAKTKSDLVEFGGMPNVELANGAISGNDTISGTFEVDSTGTSQIHFGWLDESVSLTLVDPNGHTVIDGDAGLTYASLNLGMGWTNIYHFDNIIPGSWSYQIQGVNLTQSIPYCMFLLPSSPVFLTASLLEW